MESIVQTTRNVQFRQTMQINTICER